MNDFRLDLMDACQTQADVTFEAWVSENEFWANPDLVTYSYKDHDINRRIRPDGFFMLGVGKHRIRYLLVIDRSTEDNPRFFREKILPGLAYLRREAHEQRFGHRSGRWLVVTTGERRLRNMLSQARHSRTQGLFYFTTFEKISAASMPSMPIWQRADRDELVPLLFHDETWLLYQKSIDHKKRESWP